MALITGTNQSDTIDLLSVSPGVVGGPATIGLDTVNAGNGDDNVSTGAGDDTIHGEKGNDIINAGSGNDFIDGGRGNDTIETGAGNDTVVLSKNGGIDTVTDFRSPNLTINFDDLPPLATDLPVPNGYEGLNWDNVFHTPIFDEATGTVVVGVAPRRWSDDHNGRSRFHVDLHACAWHRQPRYRGQPHRHRLG
jgi:RTX calcium-binding nonapeptide repeat (4 copies)